MNATIEGPLKWHGGKRYLAKRIVELMPPRCKNPNKPDPKDKGWLHYVEPFAGGLSVLLANDPEGISEVINDRHKALTNFWKVLQNDDLFQKFYRVIQAVPFSQQEYLYAEHWNKKDSIRFNMPRVVASDETIGKAINFFITCRQSLAGRMDGFTGITRTRARRGMNAEVSAWLNCIEGLPAVHARLKRVLILNDDALKVIKREDGERTLYYLDPPYVHETRSTTGEYDHEMTDEQHLELLNTLATVKGRWMLSGYQSELYESFFKDFPHTLYTFDLPNNSAGGKEKARKIECLWCNFKPTTTEGA